MAPRPLPLSLPVSRRLLQQQPPPPPASPRPFRAAPTLVVPVRSQKPPSLPSRSPTSLTLQLTRRPLAQAPATTLLVPAQRLPAALRARQVTRVARTRCYLREISRPSQLEVLIAATTTTSCYWPSILNGNSRYMMK